MDIKEERANAFGVFQTSLSCQDYDECKRCYIYLLTTLPETNPLYYEIDMTFNTMHNQYNRQMLELKAVYDKTSSPSKSKELQDQIFSLDYDKWMQTYIFLKQKFMENGWI